MAMIKCKKCGKQINDHAKICPNCGTANDIMFCPECDTPMKSDQSICPNCGYQKKALGKSNIPQKRLINGIVLIVLGGISIIWGLTLNFKGEETRYTSYGGDAYTGIQNASADTSNNLYKLGHVVSNGLKGIMFISGGLIITIGVNVLLKKEGN